MACLCVQVRPELRAGMEAMVSKIASGGAERGAVVASGLATFKEQFERLRRCMHLMVPHRATGSPVHPVHRAPLRWRHRV